MSDGDVFSNAKSGSSGAFSSAGERREAARRLREWEPFRADARIGGAVGMMRSLGRTVGAAPGETIAYRLADLIDPMCENNGRMQVSQFVCSSCGAGFSGGETEFFRYCPSCGARVVNGDDKCGI